MRRKSLNERLIGFILFALGAVWLLSGYSNWLPKAPDSSTESASHTRSESDKAFLTYEAQQGSSPHESSYGDKARTDSPLGQTRKRVSCRVIRVYDGDTFGCDINGNGKIDKPKETIRLLGIDSPEMHYSRKNKTFNSASPVDEPHAKDSSEWLTHKADNTTVWLEFDKRRTDRYDRSLAYAYASEHAAQTINEESLAAGKSKTLFIGKNRRYQDVFEQAEQSARHSRLGMWAH